MSKMLLDFIKTNQRKGNFVIVKSDIDGTGYHWHMFMVETKEKEPLAFAAENCPLENICMSDFIETLDYMYKNKISCEIVTDTELDSLLYEWRKNAEEAIKKFSKKEKDD